MADLTRADLPQLDWSPTARAASLASVYEHAVSTATVSEAWYAAHRSSKRLGGRALRVLALLLGAAAAVLPILSQIFTDANGQPQIEPAWASVALAIAAALVALDRYFGASDAWMRFMTAEMQIARLRQDFEYEWNIARAKAGDPPTPDEVEALLGLARKLVAGVGDAIAAETNHWVTDFRGHLQTAEQALQAPVR